MVSSSSSISIADIIRTDFSSHNNRAINYSSSHYLQRASISNLGYSRPLVSPIAIKMLPYDQGPAAQRSFVQGMEGSWTTKEGIKLLAIKGRDAHGVPVLRSFLTTTLGLPPSCIDFSPALPYCFVVGTYFLEPDSDTSHTTQVQEVENESRPVQNRRGSLILIHIQTNLL